MNSFPGGSVLALIPARGGSKGIPRKNLRKLAGLSLVEHSIRHALESKSVDRVMVSTDDPEIANVALKAGAEVPLLRPAELAGDEVLDLPVFVHALQHLECAENYKPELVVHLRPTAPFRKPEWIDQCVELLRTDRNASSVRSVSLVQQHPYRVFRINEGSGFLDPIMRNEHEFPYLLRRQDLPEMYLYNCVIDVTRRSTILGNRSMTGDAIKPFIMHPSEVVDIDTPRDLMVAEFLMEKGAGA